jgi:hypothetical protein
MVEFAHDHHVYYGSRLFPARTCPVRVSCATMLAHADLGTTRPGGTYAHQHVLDAPALRRPATTTSTWRQGCALNYHCLGLLFGAIVVLVNDVLY